ncbi:YbaB/EbfC family nucleoid-associated protein [Actinokineospora iranica]|uniref:YbaB/EbfC DNA-binding family protein n=1 Tax=Actinokineospora iranica TaxID=1271860 RepID=A0A1G6M2G5_9PSEU|nr:YbaB/EbfC family nucleoid-associated protein [Actinokineospora iranica]SDC49156.1 YbaB/EbfC DNA-binding family protein [Actinokineospora iranica]
MQTPDEWLADFEAKVADLQQKATEFKKNIESAGATERSPDGTVTVTVAPNGSLTDLHLTDDAMRKSAADLTAEILVTTRKARQRAASGVAEAFVPLGGDRAMVQRIPGAEDVAEPALPTRSRQAGTGEDDHDFADSPVIYKDDDVSW